MTPPADSVSPHSASLTPSAASSGISSSGNSAAAADQEPSLLLVTTDEGLRDEVALIAAIVGARLDTVPAWPRRSSDTGTHLAVLFAPDSPPPSAQSAEGALLIGHEARLWEVAGSMPGVTPVPLPSGEQWLSEYLSSLVLNRDQGQVMTVLGSCGGAGTSTVTYLCAAELAVQGQRPLILDAAEVPGSGLAYLVDQARDTGQLAGGDLRWGHLLRTEGTLSSTQLASSLPEVDGIGILTSAPEESPGQGDVVSMLQAAVGAGRRAYDLVFIDAGQRLSVVSTLLDQTDHVVVVTPASQRAATATQTILSRLDGPPASVVVNGRRSPGYHPEDLAELVGVPLIGELAEQPWLRKSDDPAEAYELLRSRRGARTVATILDAVGAFDA